MPSLVLIMKLKNKAIKAELFPENRSKGRHRFDILYQHTFIISDADLPITFLLPVAQLAVSSNLPQTRRRQSAMLLLSAPNLWVRSKTQFRW